MINFKLLTIFVSMNKEVLRFIKFGLFSASAGIIEIVSFTLLKEFTPSPDWLSYLIGCTASAFSGRAILRSIHSVYNPFGALAH